MMKRDIPCPVQRALETAGHIGEHVPLKPFTDLLVRAFEPKGASEQELRRATPMIAALANGFLSTFRNVRSGFRPHELRGGPLDKKGGGSRIYSQDGQFDPAEFARFETFGKQYPRADGAGTELGWGMPELTAFMDANQKRAHASRFARKVLMEGELPVLLKSMGVGEGTQLHLVAAEVRDLYEHHRFPARIENRIAGARVADPTVGKQLR
jgi:hypothetical protein